MGVYTDIIGVLVFAERCAAFTREGSSLLESSTPSNPRGIIRQLCADLSALVLSRDVSFPQPAQLSCRGCYCPTAITDR
jgi:hypothetical protein